MATKRNTKQPDAEVLVNFRVRQSLRDEFNAVVAREERTLSQDLRHYMARRIEEQKAA